MIDRNSHLLNGKFWLFLAIFGYFWLFLGSELHG
jgi:hypothetical protein